MIDRQNSKIIVECDDCGETHDSDRDDEFVVAWNEMKNLGWTAIKTVADQWYHRCPECTIKFRKPMFK